MITLKISEAVAERIGINYEALKELDSRPEASFLFDVDELENQLFNFYYMNKLDHLILSYPIKPMLDKIVPEFVFGPSIIGNIKKGLFFDNIPYSDEVKKELHVDIKQYRFSRINPEELALLHQVYSTERQLIEGEINRRINI